MSTKAIGALVPNPTKPEFKIVIASVAQLLPTRKCMSAPVAPTQEVVWKVKSWVVPEPPVKNGLISEPEADKTVVDAYGKTEAVLLVAVKLVPVIRPVEVKAPDETIERRETPVTSKLPETLTLPAKVEVAVVEVAKKEPI